MANTTQDTLYEMFLALAADMGQTPNPMIEASQELAHSADSVSQAMESVGTTWDRVTPLAVDTPTKSTSSSQTTSAGADGESLASTILNAVIGTIPAAGTILSDKGSAGSSSTIETIASTVLKSGLGLIPLVGGLLGLFGGRDSETPAPLVKYALPPALQFQGAQSEWGLGNSDYDQMGMPRLYPADAPSSSGSAGDYGASVAGGSGAPAPQITVNVNAMDARSFLDRSSDIAAAVRDAMLNLNSINDVVNEL